MAYNYFPYNYQPYQTQQPQNTILWVQGIEGAKAHPVAAGGSVLLMDSEESQFYIKTADAAGMPTLRVFEYKELTQTQKPTVDMSGYVTKEELEKRLNEIMGGKHESDIRTVEPTE